MRILSLLLIAADPLALAAQTVPSFSPRSMVYVLQPDSFNKDRVAAVKTLAQCDRDLVVLDPGFSGTADGRWKKEEIDTIRKGRPGRHVVAYLSIGEAKNYRPYWKTEWDRDNNGKPDASAPAYLLGFLSPFRKGGKPVLLIEYGTSDKANNASMDGARENDFVLLLTDRPLKTLGVAPTQP